MVTLLWAQTKKGIIGKENSLPWRIKEEMKHFVSYTTGKSILMGRNTWNSIPNKPLKNRINYIASRDETFTVDFPDTYIIRGVEQFLTDWSSNSEELVVIGGAMLYKNAIKFAKKLVISIIKEDYLGDVEMCPIDFEEFVLTSNEERDEFNIMIYERK